MLGDVPIFGNFPCGIDDKGRIILPSYTEVAKGDKVVFCISDIGTDAIDLYPLSVISDIVKKYDELIFTSVDSNVVERAKVERRRLCSSAIVQASVDGQRRLSINPAILSLFGENTVKLYALGEANRIKLFASEEKFSEYTGHTYMKRV